jgi:hypothetical protein
MQELALKYGDRLKYVEIDGSDKALSVSTKIASELGVTTFLADNTTMAPIVGIFKGKKKIKELQGYKHKEEFASAIEKSFDKK